MALRLARIFLVAATTACIIVVAYSVAITASAGQVFAYALAAAGAGILALMVLVGLIDADKADDGLLSSVLSLLPKAMKHAMADVPRAFLIGIGLCALAAVSYWIGPAGLGNAAISCAEAKKIQPIVGSAPTDCKTTHTERYWRTPLNREATPALICYDANLVAWNGTWTSPGIGTCGDRPREARFATTGIDFQPPNGTGVTATRDREGFARLTEGLATDLPQVRQAEDTILFATWNIRNLGRLERQPMSYAYIAQVISHFDIVAFQELQSQAGLEQIMDHLGPDWHAEYGLQSPGSMGNRERLGFLYDSRKIRVDPVSSNMVLASSDLSHTVTGQPARPPFVAAFSVNGRKVLIANTHIVFGRPDARADRIEELKVIAQNLSEHADGSFGGIPALLVGDMNAEYPDGPVIAEVEDAGYVTDPVLKEAPSSDVTDKVYDQIFVRADPDRRLVFGRVGAFAPFDHVMRIEDMPLYKTDLAREVDLTGDDRRNRSYFMRWRANEISDHRVKWAEFRMDWPLPAPGSERQ